MADLVELFSSESFYYPFVSTVSAAVVLLLLQASARRAKEGRQKLYAVAYLLDTCYRMQHSALVLLRHTILPHIEATRRIIKGDPQLLEKMLLSGEFDVLTDSAVVFDQLPLEYKVLLGNDDVELAQLAEFIRYLARNDRQNRALNDFVGAHLKDYRSIKLLSEDERASVLNTYWDYMSDMKLAQERVVATVTHIALPRYLAYSKSWRFVLMSKRAVKLAASKIESTAEQFSDLVPPPNFTEDRITQGIQRAL